MAEAALKQTVRELYHGQKKRSQAFRYGLMIFDVLTIVFFLATTPVELNSTILFFDFAIGSLILLDFLARLWIAPSRSRMLLQPYTLADIVVIFSLLLAPLIAQNFAFLRVLRALRLLHSYHVLRDLRRETFFREHEDVIVSSVNLFVFIFVVTALVYVLQVNRNPDIRHYLDALYFTVATLTTTGFGDITLEGDSGRFLSVVIMVIGVALFLRLAQTIFMPSKVHYKCPECGLNRHDKDAVHCKHCGEGLKIETKGGS